MWNGEKIRVMGVDIEPPYRPENIKSSPDNKALNHIRKIVSSTINIMRKAKYLLCYKSNFFFCNIMLTKSKCEKTRNFLIPKIIHKTHFGKTRNFLTA